jgi:magnesium chelatase family protein
MVTRTQKRISSALMDWIDIHMQVPSVEFTKLRAMRLGETSAEGVNGWRQPASGSTSGLQARTSTATPTCDQQLIIRKCCVLDEACQALMKTAMGQIQLMARAYHNMLKLSRTVADLLEALQYWPKLALM